MNEQQELKRLLEIIERLLGPGGCPWDREQTLHSLRSNIVEESCELVEAIDLNDSQHIKEELGDLCFVALFLCKIAEKEQHCTAAEAIYDISEKLVRRHPHVFGDVQINDSKAVVKQWNEIKSKEKGKSHRKSALDGIPKQLPALARAQKIAKKVRKANFEIVKEKISLSNIKDEASLGQLLLQIAALADEAGLDAEHALRKALTHTEKQFRAFEGERLGKHMN